MDILGISFLGCESASCLIRDGEIIAAAQEERFTRNKHDHSFPRNSIRWCLEYAKIKNVDAVAFSDDQPFHKLAALVNLKALGIKAKAFFFPVEESFSACAFYPSNLQEAAILINNGTKCGLLFARGESEKIIPLKNSYRLSLGRVYSDVTEFLGFKRNSDEFRVMGLAAYGKPLYRDTILKFKRNFSGLRIKKRACGGEITQGHKDIAASIQAAVESEALKLSSELHKITSAQNLCLAGDMALNCLINAAIRKQGLYKDVWIQPAAASYGTCLGAAFLVWHKIYGKERNVITGKDLMNGCFLGPEFSDKEIENILLANKIKYEKLLSVDVPKKSAELISSGKVLGWFQGKMEFGPRALGARSILADSRFPGIHDRLNLKVKIRENFRPFAPSVLAGRAQDYFELKTDSPYMLLVADVKQAKRGEIPGVVHADGSSRVQTVSLETNPLYYGLINEFFKKTGCPVIMNTSFNTGNEPIVRTPEEALRCFMDTDMDFLMLGNFLVDKRRLN